jgi:type II secretory pathway component PulC
LAHVAQFLFPALRVSLFRFRHAQQNGFALFVGFARGQIAINLRGLDLRAPIPFDHLNRLLSILRTFGHVEVKPKERRLPSRRLN